MDFINYVLFKSVDSLGWWDRFNFVIKRSMAYGSICDFRLFMGFGLISKSMFHPINIVSIWEVIPSVGATRLLSVFGCIYCHFTLNKEVLKLEGFNVAHQAWIRICC